jgi:hypothetical protein
LKYYDEISLAHCPFQILGYVEIGCNSHLFQILGPYLGLGYDKTSIPNPSLLATLIHLPITFDAAVTPLKWKRTCNI